MPNGGSGIGVAVSDDPGGPFVDALGSTLISGGTPGVSDVDWIFDPACFVDDDGQAYLYFGGGPSNTGDNGRVIRLGDDMTSLADPSATTVPMPDFFEAMYVHERDGTYYLQFSSDFSNGGATIDYMMSDDPMQGFTFAGTIVSNGAINSNNNNHASVIDFMGRTYVFYHNRKLEQDLGLDLVNNRSVAVEEITYADDGTINPIMMSTDDLTVEQIKCLDGFSEVQAETLAAESGIETEGDNAAGVRVVDIDNGDWLGYSQVDFHDGATLLVLRVASAAGGGTIDVRIDGCDDFTEQAGTSIGTCDLVATGGDDTFAELSCMLTQTAGPHDLCLQFSDVPAFELDSFHLE